MGHTVCKYLSDCLNTIDRNNEVDDYKWTDYEYVDISKSTDKLSDCFIASSHNTAIGDLQILGGANVNHIIHALNQKVRMIELDIFVSHNDKTIPVVSHGRLKSNLQVTSNIYFESCLKAIEKYAWKCTNEPLFLALEMNLISGAAATNVQRLLLKYFPLHILLPRRDKKLNEYKLSELTNKLVILPMLHRKELRGLAYTSMYNSRTFVNKPHTEHVQRDSTRMIRIYPRNTILSKNFDFTEFMYYCQFVCLNLSYKDQYLEQYLKIFKNKGIRTFTELRLGL